MADKKTPATPTTKGLSQETKDQLSSLGNEDAPMGGPKTGGFGTGKKTTAPGVPNWNDLQLETINRGTFPNLYRAIEERQIIQLDTAGVPGFAKTTYVVNVYRTIAQMDEKELEAYQRSLWEAGLYPSEYYRQATTGGQAVRPLYGKLTDEGLMYATNQLLESTLAVGATRRGAVPPMLQVLNDRKTQFGPAVAAAQTGGGTGGPQVDVIGTQVVELPAVTDIGAMVDKAATNVLGRKLNAKDRERFVSLVSEMYRQQGMTAADVRVANQKAGYPYVTGGVQQAETVGKEFAGKENPFARTLYNEVKKAFPEVSFLGIWGNEEHKKRKSDHNTGDAVDIGFKSKQTADLILQTALKGKNVKYVILGRDVYYPDGRVDRNGASSDHKNHVHVSFFRTAPAGSAAAGDKGTAKSGETLASGGENEGVATGQTPESAATGGTGTGVTGAPGMVSVTAKYPGAVSTPTGGSVLVTQSPMGQSGVEEQIRKENPVEAGAIGTMRNFDVFLDLIRGGR